MDHRRRLLLGGQRTAERGRSLEVQEGVEGAEEQLSLEPRSEPEDEATT